MNLYLKNAENIYFPQISEYFREVISSYDNGNYRSAIVMLYSTIVCDLILKLKELSEVYSDSKAESMLAEIDKQRAKAFDSSWEWKLIHSIRDRTELLSDEAFAMLQHIYDLRNFSAHPAMNEEYELISPTPEMTVAYIKQALDCVLTKPSVFAQNIVDRISDDIANRKDIFLNDLKVLNNYLEKVYFSRMSAKVKNQVFKAFWKFTFKKDEGEIFDSNRVINRKTLEILLSKHGQEICQYVRENAAFFTASNSSKCMKNLCVLLAYYPQVYDCLDDNTKHQIVAFDADNFVLIKWFITGCLEDHLSSLRIQRDRISEKLLAILREVCNRQGLPHLFPQFLIEYYSQCCTYISAGNRFDNTIEPNLEHFSADDFTKLIQAIDSNPTIHNYYGQKRRNDVIIEKALQVLPKDYALHAYKNFQYTEREKTDVVDTPLLLDEELPF